MFSIGAVPKFVRGGRIHPAHVSISQQQHQQLQQHRRHQQATKPRASATSNTIVRFQATAPTTASGRLDYR
eukprot:1664929-Alexandrium_andersonii.AAC.1